MKTLPQLTQIMHDLLELLKGADVSVTLDNYKRDAYPGRVLNIQVNTRRVLSMKEHGLGVVIRLDEGHEAAAFLVADALEKVFRHHRKENATEEDGGL